MQAEEYRRRQASHELVTREEEVELVRRSQDGERAATARLVEAHQRFVMGQAGEYSRRHRLDFDEMIQQCNIGLLIAIRKFDPARGMRLITYAIWWMRALMKSFHLNNHGPMRLGTTRGQRTLFFRLRGEQTRSTDPAVIAAATGTTEREVREMDQRLRPVLSLDAPVPGGSALGDTLPADSASQPDEAIAAAFVRDPRLHILLAAAMARLPQRFRFVFEQRRLVDPPPTLEELSGVLGVSRERVRQLDTKAFEKVRAFMLHHQRRGTTLAAPEGPLVCTAPPEPKPVFGTRVRRKRILEEAFPVASRRRRRSAAGQ